MVLFPVILFLLCSSYSESKRDLRSLRLVMVVSRHGERTPVNTYPKDPHINHTYYPYGWGQLTKKGKQKQYELGKYLRRRYSDYLGVMYSPKVITAQSTDSDRTKMSAQLQLAGLFPPIGEQCWDPKLRWQPIPVNYEPLDEDKLLLMRVPCARYYEIKHHVLHLKEVRNDVYSESLYDKLTELTGSVIETPDDVQSLYSTLKAQEEYGLPLPRWVYEFYPSVLERITAKSFELNAYNAEMKKLKAGLLVKKMLLHIYDTINNLDEQRKMLLYVGHDSTIANLLLALNMWELQVPSYNSIVMVELHEPYAGEYAVKVMLRNSSRPEPYCLRMRGCKKMCPLDKFIQLLKNIIPNDIAKECQSKDTNFIQPTMPLP